MDMKNFSFQSTILGDEYMDMLDTKLFRTLKVVNIVTWTTVIIGLAAVLLTFFMFVYIKAP
ncbi:hypothetical protein NQ317_010231 [Molorchus minor]|uniref:Uncharacterized protein n=1 Tax=Molorchus minor TaxID=1323400 RepID=A0ABQ9J3T1_9CUCU|nr:hypothetical protein NQ317_010231 [Molorchus minor]